jgi:hypothetical protein
MQSFSATCGPGRASTVVNSNTRQVCSETCSQAWLAAEWNTRRTWLAPQSVTSELRLVLPFEFRDDWLSCIFSKDNRGVHECQCIRKCLSESRSLQLGQQITTLLRTTWSALCRGDLLAGLPVSERSAETGRRAHRPVEAASLTSTHHPTRIFTPHVTGRPTMHSNGPTGDDATSDKLDSATTEKRPRHARTMKDNCSA